MASRQIHPRGNSSSSHAHASDHTLTATARGTMGVSASMCLRRFCPRSECTHPGVAADDSKSNSNPITPVILTDRVGQMPSNPLFKNVFSRSSRGNEAQISLKTIIHSEPPHQSSHQVLRPGRRRLLLL